MVNNVTFITPPFFDLSKSALCACHYHVTFAFTVIWNLATHGFIPPGPMLILYDFCSTSSVFSCLHCHFPFLSKPTLFKFSCNPTYYHPAFRIPLARILTCFLFMFNTSSLAIHDSLGHFPAELSFLSFFVRLSQLFY